MFWFSDLCVQIQGREEEPGLQSGLRGAMQITSEYDEQESILSGTFSDAEEGFSTPNQYSLGTSGESRKGFFSPPVGHLNIRSGPETGN